MNTFAHNEFSKSMESEHLRLKKLVELLQADVARLEKENQMLLLNGPSPVQPEPEDEIKRRLAEYERFFKYCPNTVLFFDINLRLVLCSEYGTKRLLYNKSEDLKNLYFDEVFWRILDPRLIEKGRDLCKQSISTKSEVEYYNSSYLTTGEFHSARTTYAPVLDERGKCLGCVISVNNTTELALMRDKVEKVSRSKTRFLANVSRELRTPMNAIKGLGELLLQTTLSDTQRGYVSNITSASNSILHVLRDILDFSKLDASKIDILPREYSLDSLLKEVTSIAAVLANRKGVAFYAGIDPNLPSRLYGDSFRIKQVMLNVITNAIQYTSEGFVTLSLTCEKSSDATRLSIQVTDSGMGIPAQDIPYLFDYPSDESRQRLRPVSDGGLGLPIAKSLLTAMNGAITATSSYGKGSCFSLSIPQQVVSDLPLAKVHEVGRKEVLLLGESHNVAHYKDVLTSLRVFATTATCPEDLRNAPKFTHCINDYERDGALLEACRPLLQDCSIMVVKGVHNALNHEVASDIVLFEPLLVSSLAETLNATHQGVLVDPEKVVQRNQFVVANVKALLIEDNTINRIVAEEILSSFNVDVVSITSGEEALERCKDQAFDIIFVDNIMPGLDGVELASLLRTKDGPNRDIPIILLAAGIGADLKQNYFRSGINDILDKPIELSEAIRVLMLWLPAEKLIVEQGAA